MAKARKKTKAKRSAGSHKNKVAAGTGNLHPILAQAMSSGARLVHGQYEVAEVQNPYGEVVIRGEMRRHKAVRRVPHFETLYRSKVIDRTVFACLEWYADRLALAQSGLIKCGLNISGSVGGSAFHHIPTAQAAMEARSDVDWARGFIPDNDLRRVFDGVMGSMEAEGGDTFETIGVQVYPSVCSDRAKRKASSAFKVAANYLLAGIGSRVVGYAEAA